MPQHKTIEDRLLSDENIFLAINYVDSYILNKELLSISDQNYLAHLNDVFNEPLILKTIENIKKQLRVLLNKDDEYLEITTYFKPKKYDKEKKEIIFRPLHTASLINQICMVAMLQILIFDFSDNNIKPSEISRLIPSNFYGNRISFDSITLFKPWGKQYEEYTSYANNLYNESIKHTKYKYEIILDLKNFFPSINPEVLQNYFETLLPSNLNEKDKTTYKKIINKLLYFKLTNNFTENDCKMYYSKLKYKSHEAKYYSKGLPQGLPHTYFFANLYMLIIKNIYTKHFPGETLFYVDDSVCFSNIQLDEKSFRNHIIAINEEIKAYNKKSISSKCSYPNEFDYKKEDFNVKVHTEGKSILTIIERNNKTFGELYLNGICREASVFSFNFYSSLSDEELETLYKKTQILSQQIELEISRYENLIGKDTKLKNSKLENSNKEKLIRYKKFFKYRLKILEIKTKKLDPTENALNGADLIKYTEDEVINSIANIIHKKNMTNEKIKSELMDLLSNDSVLSILNFIQNVYKNENKTSEKIKNIFVELNNVIFQSNTQYSYLEKSNEKFLQKNLNISKISKYKTLEKLVRKQLKGAISQIYPNKMKYFFEILNDSKKENQKLFNFFELKNLFNNSIFLRTKNDNLIRMILNCSFSVIFRYNVNDSFNIEKKENSNIRYYEILTLSNLKNNKFILDNFFEKYNHYLLDDYLITIDYSILQVLPIFKSFVRDINLIEKLIYTHKYCSDTWKNGSKYLHFYTLHNQEHAINLIRNSIHIIHSFSFFQMKMIDFYILFAACYLHDISMVSIPSYNLFTEHDNEIANKIYTDFIFKFRELNNLKTNYNFTEKKNLLCETYKKIDSFFETEIRNSHAFSSAHEIRKFPELNYFDDSIRDLIAEVSLSHGINVEDIYKSKSNAANSLISLKYIKILLRLSDLLDISRYRISKVILDHNLKELNTISRFHWISHLITAGYTLVNEYKIDEQFIENKNLIAKKRIIEIVNLNINVLLSQTTKVNNNRSCNKCENIDSTLFTEAN